MSQFIFRCPATGFNVQHQLDDDPDISENEYEAIPCPACTGIHLVNRKTGELLGQDDEYGRQRPTHADLQARPRPLLKCRVGSFSVGQPHLFPNMGDSILSTFQSKKS